MRHASRELAIRLEQAGVAAALDAAATHRCLFPNSSAEVMESGSGVAVFIDEQSPLTQVRGVGMAGMTPESDVDEIESFFEERMAPVAIVINPFTDAALLTHLARRGYDFGAFENVMVRGVTSSDRGLFPEVTLADNSEDWCRVMVEAFYDEDSPMGMELARILFALPKRRNLIVWAEDDGAGAAQLEIHDGLGVLQCDGTVPRYRGKGVQTRLIQARVALAAEAGCDLVTADTAPGSQSQRNYERLGFQVAYTKVTLIKPCF